MEEQLCLPVETTQLADVGPRKVAVLGPWAAPVTEPFAGGLESHVWHLCRQLTLRGHEVTLVGRRGSDPSVATRFRELDEVWTPSAEARRDTSMTDERTVREHHAYLDAVTWLAELDVDVVHNHAYHYLPFVLGGQDTPWVSTLHTPPTPWIESALAARRRGTMRYTTVSTFAARLWSRLPARPTVVANGIDPRRWSEGPGGTGLVWTGRIARQKAPHLAIATARRLAVPLVLAGPVEDERYFAEAVRPHLHDGVEYAGHLRQAELADLVGHSAAALVTPVWDEPFGQVAAEALMCGTPVVALNRGALPEVLGPLGAGHLVDAVSADAWGAALERGIAELAAATERAMGAHRPTVRDDAAQRLGLAAMVTGYEQIYATTVEVRRMGSHPSPLPVPLRP